MIVVVLLALWASRVAGTRDAIKEARDKTEIMAQAAVAADIPKELVAGDPAALKQMDELIRNRMLGPEVARVKIWAPDGTIIYSDEPRLIGENYPLGEDEQATLKSGEVEAEVSDLSKPENRYEQSVGKMLEVYLPIKAPSGEPLLFETYYDYSAVTSTARSTLASFAPIIIGGVVLYGLLILPIAWRLTGRIKRDQLAKERLLQAAISASDSERRKIAADLHDGVVQDLSGVALNLAGVADRLSANAQEGDGRAQDAVVVRNSAGHARSAVTALRSLLVEIYPANLAEAGLENAISGLLASLSARGVSTSLIVTAPQLIPEETNAVLFRVAQEALRNVVKHAQASEVAVEVTGLAASAVMTVTDNGVGIGAGVADHVPTGHFGLRSIRDLAKDVDGTLDISAGADGGTKLRIEVPNR